MENKRKKHGIPPFIGIAAVWFGSHVGPGTASGKQVTTYYSKYGKLGIFLPMIAMAVLGVAVYYALEYARKNDLHDFRSFTNKFFYPHEKLFGMFFEISFLLTCLLAPGASIATGASIFNQHFGLNMVVGTALIALIALILSVYGQELVKSSSTALTIGILLAMGVIAVLGMNLGLDTFKKHWVSSSVKEVSVLGGIWSAITYTGFQVTGILGNTISVSKGLKSKKDSMKAAALGTFLNATLLMVILLIVYGFQPASYESLLPNYYVVTKLAMPSLSIIYVVLVVSASLSTVIGFASGVVARYEKHIKIENSTIKRLFIVGIMLILAIGVSSFGLAAIINVGYRYLGFLSIPFVLIPVIFVGIKKQRLGKTEHVKA